MKWLAYVALLVPALSFGGEFTIIKADEFGRLNVSVGTYRTINAIDGPTQVFKAPDYTPVSAYTNLHIVAVGESYDLAVMTAEEKQAQADAIQAASDAEVEDRVRNGLTADEKVEFAVILDLMNQIIAGRTNLISEVEAQDLLIEKAKELRATE